MFQSSFKRILTKSIRRFHQQTENIVDDLVANRTPSITWNSDILHGLTPEQMEFRQMVRDFAQKELPEELVKKVAI